MAVTDTDYGMAAIQVQILLPLSSQTWILSLLRCSHRKADIRRIDSFYSSFLKYDIPSRPRLECGRFQAQTGRFVQPEHEVHVLHGLPAGAFEQVVYRGRDQQFIAELIHVHQGLVGVDHLLHVDGLVHVMRESRVLVILLVKPGKIPGIDRCVHTDHLGGKIPRAKSPR